MPRPVTPDLIGGPCLRRTWIPGLAGYDIKKLYMTIAPSRRPRPDRVKEPGDWVGALKAVVAGLAAAAHQAAGDTRRKKQG